MCCLRYISPTCKSYIPLDQWSNYELAATLRWFTAGGAIRIALRQLLQNWKLRHLWRHNLGSRWKLQKMARQNFSIGASYNITKNQHSPIKTVGRDFLSPKTPKNTIFLRVTQPPWVTQTDKQTNRQDTTKIMVTWPWTNIQLKDRKHWSSPMPYCQLVCHFDFMLP